MSEWLQDHVDYLREHASLGAKAVSRALGRSEGSVKVKAHKMGVSLGKGVRSAWSDADTVRLRAFAGLGDVAVADLSCRSLYATRSFAQSCGISLKRNPDMLDAVEESAAIMEHDGGWPRAASDAMAAACNYMINGDGFHPIARAFMRANLPDGDRLYREADPLGTQVALAEYAFGVIGSLDDVKAVDRDLHDRFQHQSRLWDRSATTEERAEHAGGMTRGYLALAERILTSGD